MAAAVAMGLAKICSHWEKTRLDVMPKDRRGERRRREVWACVS